MIKVIESRCPQNHPCPLVRACPAGAIRQERWGAPIIDEEACIECGLCTRGCAYRALVDGTNEESRRPYPV